MGEIGAHAHGHFRLTGERRALVNLHFLPPRVDGQYCRRLGVLELDAQPGIPGLRVPDMV